MKPASLAIVVLLALGASAQTRRARKPAAPPPVVAEGANWPLERLSVDGNHNYTAEQILAVAGLRVGQIAGKPEFEAARERLVATGAFDRVGYRFAPAKDNKGYDATIEVAEMAQMYPMRFEDLPATDAQLRAWLKQKDPLFGPRIPATKGELDRYAQWISEFLAKQNYHEPVAGRVVPNIPPELVILFRPAKPRPSVAQVKFTDTGELPPGMLQSAMFGIAIGVGYTEAQFRQLLDTTIRPLYEARGRIRVSFPKIETEPAKDVDGVVVTVQVDPGEAYKLGRVSLQGANFSPQQFTKLAALKSGQTVNFEDVKAAQVRIEQSLRRTGYVDVKTQVLRDLHDADKTVDLRFQIATGPQFTMGKLEIVGLDIETEPAIRKLWGLQSGKPFNVEYPNHFLDRLREEGIFDNLKSTRSDTKINPDEHTADVILYFNK